MDKPNRLLPYTRQRDHLQEHQARMTVLSARDHASVNPGHLADRFIPCRSREEDQSAFDDFRSPKRFAYARNVSLCALHLAVPTFALAVYVVSVTQEQDLQSAAFSSFLASTLGLKTPPQDLQTVNTSKSLSPT